MNTLVLKIEYDGTNYSGWQVQNNAKSVQGEIQQAMFKSFGKPMSIVGAGRTDAGVHAAGQVAHSKLEEPLKISSDKIVKAINFYLPNDIKIQDAAIIPHEFHAVRDAISREYNYFLHRGTHPLLRHFSSQMKFPFKEELLHDTAKVFIGEYDFTTFSKNNTETECYICKVENCFWEKIADYQWRMTITANRFVYGMVRSLVGAMLDSARGKRTLDDISGSLIKKNRNLSSPLAPAIGLVLNKVIYDFELF